MAIDMTTVKAISYNNKDVVKIEDSNGNILWQVATPSSKFFLSSSGRNYEVDNNTVSSKTWSGLTSFKGNNIWTDGDKIYHTHNGTTYELDESTSTWSQSTITFPGTTNNNGNYIWTDGTNIFLSYNAIQYKFDKANKTWTSVTWTGTEPNGNGIFKVGNKIYCAIGSNSNLLEVDTTNFTTTVVGSGFPYYGWTVWTDGTNYYSSNNNTYLLDFDTMTWTAKTWTGFTAINGARIIKYNGEIIAQEGSSPYGFYKLDVATSTWTSYTFSGTSVQAAILDMSWDYHGRITNVNCAAVTHK